MKNRRKKISKILITALLLVGIGSCYKTSSLGGAGISVVLFPASVTINSYPLATGTQLLSIVEVRRDVPNQSALNTAQTVVVSLNNTVITNYNTANAAAYAPLVSTAYTFDASNPADASGNITINFAAGEFAKPIKINTDLSKLPAGTNALGFSIKTATGATIGSTKDAFVSIGAKNIYEASYTVTGYFYHPSSPRAIAATKAITTLGVTTCKAVHSDLAGYFLGFDVSSTNTLINYVALGSTPAAPASGFFTSDNPGATDYSAALPQTPPGVAPFVQDTYNNTYNPNTKTFYMHYGYGGGSTAQTGWTRQIYEKWVRQ